MMSFVTVLATSSPPIGGIIGIVVFFGAIIALSLWSVKSAGKKGAQKIKEKYGDRIIEEGVFDKSMHYFFTQDEFLAQKYNVVFAVYRLSDIRYIGIRWDSVLRQNVIFMTDADGKQVKPAEVVGGTKAAQKMYGKNLISGNEEDIKKICAAIMQHGPHIQYEQKK